MSTEKLRAALEGWNERQIGVTWLDLRHGCNMADAIREHLAEQEQVCRWTEDGPVWCTECGNSWQFMVDGPAENDCEFCMYCGRRIEVTE